MNCETKRHLPSIAITMGDPAGVGAEIILKALSLPVIYEFCAPFVIGNRSVLEHCAKQVLADMPSFVEIPDVAEFDTSSLSPDTIAVHVVDDGVAVEGIDVGKVSAQCGKAAYLYIERATQLALLRKIDAITTAPLCKESLHLAGYLYPGHTEILARLTNTSNYAMMFQGAGMRVVLYTIHIPLRDVAKKLNEHDLLSLIQLTNKGMKRFGISKPRIALCGLNPHCGEAGAFGKEEEQHITPAIKAAVSKGINATGPYPADTVFFKAVRGEFDVVIAMYHDQALIALKTLDFYKSVNITIGLPIIRTSVDHGTAFDIVGKGIADPSSLIEALRTAALMVQHE